MAAFLPTDFLGRWSLKRVIHDRRAATTLDADGVAEFRLTAPGQVEWVENGELHLPAGSIPVTATRHLRLSDDGTWTTDFADGREFHPWALGVDLIHECSPDHYVGWIEVDEEARDDAWRMRWSATGPAKDYVIETEYSRLSD